MSGSVCSAAGGKPKLQQEQTTYVSEWQVVDTATGVPAAAGGPAAFRKHVAAWRANAQTLRLRDNRTNPVAQTLQGLQFLQLTVAAGGAAASRASPEAAAAGLRLATTGQAALAHPAASTGSASAVDGTAAAVWGLLRVAATELQGIPVTGTSVDVATGRELQRRVSPQYADAHGAERSNGAWAAPRLLPSRAPEDAGATAGVSATGQQPLSNCSTGRPAVALARASRTARLAGM